MSVVDVIIGWFTGETPAQIEAGFEETRKEILGEYSPAELLQMERDETAHYVAESSAWAMVEYSFNEADTVMFVREYVIDQQGRKHVIRCDEYPKTPTQPLPTKPELVFGEVVEDEMTYAEYLLMTGGA